MVKVKWLKEPKYIETRIILFFILSLFLVLITLFFVFLSHFGRIKSDFWFFLPLALILLLIIYGYYNIFVPYKKFKHLLQLFNSGQTYSHFSDLKNPLSKDYVELDNRLAQILDSDILMSVSKRQAQYLALQNQINPHFLYNTLEGIRSEALSEGNISISSMCEALATFFRYTISHVQNLVPLSQELENTQNYFYIQQYRFGERLSMEISFIDGCKEDALRIRIPKLTLQPIVENAIVHGLECKKGKGLLLINIELFDSRLLISVKDNGVGMDEEKLKKLQRLLSKEGADQQDYNSNEGGIALINVNNRIKILFGERFGLNVTSCKDLGTDVNISLPIEYKSSEDS
ncbi:MAG: sensor histidine kinase [Spirochaetia bacterium]|nr:sensor histidine kinase [Spirochaetia bacterium]